MSRWLADRRMSAEEAAALIHHGDIIGASGFTPSGYPKAVPVALARRARAVQESGNPFQVALYTGASTGDELDGELTRANALSHRYPYQSHPDLRCAINEGRIEFADLHLSHMAQYVRSGFLKKPTVALIEVSDITPEGHVYLSTSGGMSASYLMMADRIILEWNRRYGEGLRGYHDVFIPSAPPLREQIPILKASDRIGQSYIPVPQDKIVAIVETNLSDSSREFKASDDVAQQIAGHLVDFIEAERRTGRLPRGIPFQSGVGNVANAVLGAIAAAPGMEPMTLYTEVIQDSLFQLLDSDRLAFASGTALAFSPKLQQRFISEMNDLRSRILLRQQEISNHPEVIRRLGILAMNTALEIDMFGNVNSTHVLGSAMMNGIGGSADFTRNAWLPIFMTPSTQKNGAISTIVPMVTHVDHNEHSTKIFVTEQGLADVRGLSPVARARCIIDHCAHPDYRSLLRDYLESGLRLAPSRHTPHLLDRAFEFHIRYQQTGTMKPA